MKNLMLLIFASFVLFCIFPSCKKSNEDNKDYRTKYTGTYAFTVINKSFNMLDSSYASDTVSYLGKIQCSDTIDNNQIIINYLIDKTIIVTVDEQGQTTYPENNFNGNFIKENELYFYYSWGGHGGGGSHEVNGLKQKVLH